jgi:predicted nucleic-acid-binding Zn-ribbon protein
MKGWTSEMDISVEQKNKFVNYLNSKWPEPQLCPICKAQNWVIPSSIYEIREVKPKDKFRFAPLIQVICNNCGHTLLFNAIVSGIYKKEKKNKDK